MVRLLTAAAAENLSESRNRLSCRPATSNAFRVDTALSLGFVQHRVQNRLLLAFGVATSLIGALILFHLRGLNRRIERYDDANRKAHDVLVATVNAQGKAAEDLAREDREVNRAARSRLVDAVSGLQYEVSGLKDDVSVLRDRSDRSNLSKRSGGSTG